MIQELVIRTRQSEIVREGDSIASLRPSYRFSNHSRSKMKYFWIVLGCLFGILGGCTRSSQNSALDRWMRDQEHLRVLSTTAMIQDIVKEIGGERIAALCLLEGGVDPHSYELVKGDAEKIAAADLIFYNGLGLEHGASLRYQLEHRPSAVAVGRVLEREVPEQMIWIDGQLDPHVWMDVALWSRIVTPIIEHLSALDPEGRSFFEERGKKVQEKMSLSHQEISAIFQQIPEEKRYLVTSHDAFNYFARAYLALPQEMASSLWLARCMAPEGLSPEGQISTLDIQKVVDHLEKYQISVIFPETNISKDSLKKIAHACEQKGFRVQISLEPLYGDAMEEKGGKPTTYLEMMQHNAEVISEAWRNERN